MHEYIVGIDPSTRGTGICVIDAKDGEVVHTDVFGEALKRTDAFKMKIERMIDIARGVVNVICNFSKDDSVVKCVAMEDFAYGSRGAQNDLGGVQWVLITQIYLSNKIVTKKTAIKRARKLVLGYGGVKKSEVKNILKKRGLSFRDHNIADAYVICECERIEMNKSL